MLKSPRFSGNKRIQQVAVNQPSMSQGEKGEAVAIIQMALVDLSFAMPLTTAGGQKLPDGIFGVETARVVRLFQATKALAVDGVIGPNTLAKLEQCIIELTERQAKERRLEVLRKVTFRNT